MQERRARPRRASRPGRPRPRRRRRSSAPATPNARASSSQSGARAEVDGACGGRPRTCPAAGGPCPSDALSSSSDLDRQLLLDRGRELLHVHQERALAGDADDRSRRGARPGRRARPAGRSPSCPSPPEVIQRRGASKPQPAGRPHLVLADVGGHDRVAERGRPARRARTPGATQPASAGSGLAQRVRRPASRGSARHHSASRRVVGVAACRRRAISAASASLRVAHDRDVRPATILPISVGVDVDVDDLRAAARTRPARRSRGRRSGRRWRRSGRPRPSPSWRPRVPCMPSIPSHCGSRRGERAERHQRRRHRRAGSRASVAQLVRRVGLDDAAARVEHRAPRGRDAPPPPSAPGARSGRSRGR